MPTCLTIPLPPPSVCLSIYRPPSLSPSLFPAPSPYLSGVGFHITAAAAAAVSTLGNAIPRGERGDGRAGWRGRHWTGVQKSQLYVYSLLRYQESPSSQPYPVLLMMPAKLGLKYSNPTLKRPGHRPVGRERGGAKRYTQK